MAEGYWLYKELKGEECYEVLPLHVTVTDKDEGEVWSGPVTEYEWPNIYFDHGGVEHKLHLLPSKDANRLYDYGENLLVSGCHIELVPIEEAPSRV